MSYSKCPAAAIPAAIVPIPVVVRFVGVVAIVAVAAASRGPWSSSPSCPPSVAVFILLLETLALVRTNPDLVVVVTVVAAQLPPLPLSSGSLPERPTASIIATQVPDATAAAPTGRNDGDDDGTDDDSGDDGTDDNSGDDGTDDNSGDDGTDDYGDDDDDGDGDDDNGNDVTDGGGQ
ncbi:hypothetical protein EDB85DRAFT_2296212 [Lactarius pseudohatsudake]|nr:hypothetical protein EDB85DRAFT_2296212 [Lactarius pseudohatsudake]